MPKCACSSIREDVKKNQPLSWKGRSPVADLVGMRGHSDIQIKDDKDRFTVTDVLSWLRDELTRACTLNCCANVATNTVGITLPRRASLRRQTL